VYPELSTPVLAPGCFMGYTSFAKLV